MCCGFVGSIAIAPIERSLAAGTLPGTSFQVLPPSTDLKRPTPASESLDPFGSPVPTYSVCSVGSVGSSTIDPIASEARPLEEACQVGVAANPLSVTQIPPPAAPIQTRQAF